MAKSMIRQKLGEKTFSSYVPATAENAKGLAELMPGEYEIFELVGESGDKTVTDGYYDVTVMLQNDETKSKTYIGFAMKLNKNEEDIFNAFQGKTINGVKADEVYILGMKKVVIASNDNS